MLSALVRVAAKTGVEWCPIAAVVLGEFDGDVEHGVDLFCGDVVAGHEVARGVGVEVSGGLASMAWQSRPPQR